MTRSAASKNLILAACVLAAAFLLFFWACPYLMVARHDRVCVALYVVLLIIYVFGRAIFGRRGGTPSEQPPAQR